MKKHRHLAVGLTAAIGALVGMVLWYGGRTMPATAAVLSSSAVLLALLAHLGVLAAVVAPLLAWRYRTRRRNRSRD
jgi:membrane protein implicated in regulation of membrane protease activity